MAITTVNITGTVQKPNGQLIRNGRIEFTLVGSVLTSAGAVTSDPVTVVLSGNGTFSVPLWRNDTFAYPTYYRVVAYDYDDVLEKSGKGYDLGRAWINAAGNLSNFISVPPFYRFDRKLRVVSGDTIVLNTVYVDGNRIPIDLSTVTLTAVVLANGVEYPLTITETGPRGVLLIEGDSTGIPLGQHEIRLKSVSGGVTKTMIGKLEIVQ